MIIVSKSDIMKNLEFILRRRGLFLLSEDKIDIQKQQIETFRNNQKTRNVKVNS